MGDFAVGELVTAQLLRIKNGYQLIGEFLSAIYHQVSG